MAFRRASKLHACSCARGTTASVSVCVQMWTADSSSENSFSSSLPVRDRCRGGFQRRNGAVSKDTPPSDQILEPDLRRLHRGGVLASDLATSRVNHANPLQPHVAFTLHPLSHARGERLAFRPSNCNCLLQKKAECKTIWNNMACYICI